MTKHSEDQKEDKFGSLSIRIAQNGFILKDYGDYDIEQVFEIDENKSIDCEAVQKLLYAVIDSLGVSGSKHDEERIRIEIIKKNE